MTAVAAPSRPHPYQPRPQMYRNFSTPPLCTCGLRSAHRKHQPRWWRALHPMAAWR